MTFITQASPRDRASGAAPSFGLSQRSRASVEVLGSIQKTSSGPVRTQAEQNFAAHPEGRRMIEDGVPDPSPAAMRERVARAKAVAEADPLFRLERFIQRYVGEEIFVRAIPAVEERREQFESFMTPGEETAGGTLELNPDIPRPKYYSETEWHLEPGGWDGYDLYGPVLGHVIAPFIFRHGGYAAVPLGENITRHRVEVLKRLPKDRYARIYEPGCGGATVASAIAEVYPEAEIVGSDLSPLLLKNGHLIAERRGVKVALKQREPTDTGEPDESFDAVINFALQHELPPKVNVALFREMFRILKPGGDMVLADPPPFRAVDPFHAVILDWDTKNREEPFFSATLLSDWDEELRKIGFVDVKSFGLGPKEYPWVTLATRPLLDTPMSDTYLTPDNVDDLGRMLMALLSEMWVMRDRMAVTEKLLAEKMGLTSAEIDDVVPDAAFAAELEALRDKVVGAVIGASAAAKDRSVDSILRRAGFAESADRLAALQNT